MLYASAHQSVQENTSQADKEFLLLLVTASQCVLQYTGFKISIFKNFSFVEILCKRKKKKASLGGGGGGF